MPDKKDDKPKRVTCPSCHGRGTMGTRRKRPDGSTFIHERRCDRCQGAGTVTV